MALRMFLGKPGGGKSYGSLLQIIEELVWGVRIVVTNLPIDLGKLNEYIQRTYPDADVDLFARLVLISAEQTKRFWLYRGPNVVVPDVTKEQERRGIFPDFAAYAGPGCFFVIDEAHVPFDSREWMNSGQSLTYYNSQHRKLNDELIFVTQFLELIDKRVRGFAQEFWYFRNNGMEKIFTFFVLPDYFTARVYQKPATGIADIPSEVHRYRLNKALAACYDTSAGVGISGRKRPEERKKKGIPAMFLAVPACGAVVLVWWLPDLIARKALSTDRGKKLEQAAIGNPRRDMRLGSALESVPTERLPMPPDARLAENRELEPVGYVVRGARVNVVMSDGSVLTETDPELERIDRNGIVVNGRKLHFRYRRNRDNERKEADRTSNTGRPVELAK